MNLCCDEFTELLPLFYLNSFEVFCNGLLIEQLSSMVWHFDIYVMFLVSYFGPGPPYKVAKKGRVKNLVPGYDFLAQPKQQLSS